MTASVSSRDDTVESKQVRHLKSLIHTLKESRSSSDLMLQQLRQEVDILRRQQQDSVDSRDALALVDARKTMVTLQKENASLKQELQQRDDTTTQRLLHATPSASAVHQEVRRMKTKINKAVRQCARLQQRNTKLKEALLSYKKGGSVRTPSTMSKPKSKSATARKSSVTKTPPKKAAATVNSDDESEEEEKGGYSPQMARLMGRPAPEESEEEGESSEASSDEPAPRVSQVDHKVPGFFIQESPAEAWRKRKEAEQQNVQKKSGKKKNQKSTSKTTTVVPEQPGMAAKPGFGIAFPAQDQGVPEFMRQFQKIGMKGPEQVVEASGNVQVSDNVKVGLGGVQISGAAAAAAKAEEERKIREAERREEEEEDHQSWDLESEEDEEEEESSSA